MAVLTAAKVERLCGVEKFLHSHCETLSRYDCQRWGEIVQGVSLVLTWYPSLAHFLCPKS